MKDIEQQEQRTNISKIIKRLELVKSLIYLEEENEIVAHTSKLREFPINSELEYILTLLETKSYSKAMLAIDAFINQYHQITIYNDPELEGLRLEAKALEIEVNLLSAEKADLEKLIHEFNVRHNNELGELILNILRLRKEKAKGTRKQEEADKDYRDYSQEYEISKSESVAELTDDEAKELKQNYRRASKLCHPDVVNEDQKELADKLFAELNAAYERNDIQRVSEILNSLENGNLFINKSDTISEKQLMKVQIEKLRIGIKELKTKLQILKESEAFKTISSIDDWDNYFATTKRKLSEQVKELENE